MMLSVKCSREPKAELGSHQILASNDFTAQFVFGLGISTLYYSVLTGYGKPLFIAALLKIRNYKLCADSDNTGYYLSWN